MAKYTKRRDKRGYEWKSAYREKEALIKIDEDKQEYAALRYEEFIAPLTKYCQCLKRDLKQEIEKNQQLQFQLLNLQGEFMILKQQILGGK